MKLDASSCHTQKKGEHLNTHLPRGEVQMQISTLQVIQLYQLSGKCQSKPLGWLQKNKKTNSTCWWGCKKNWNSHTPLVKGILNKGKNYSCVPSGRGANLLSHQNMPHHTPASSTPFSTLLVGKKHQGKIKHNRNSASSKKAARDL